MRAPTLPAFQNAIARAVAEADPECAVLVPTRSAAALLRRTLAAAGEGGPADASPDSVRLLTRDGFYRHLHARLASPPRLLSEVEREALARAAARDAVRAGAAPPFRLRPGLVRLMLRFHDDLARHGRSVDAFERLAVEDLEPSAAVDRGARRLLDQTRFLVAAFRACAARIEATGALDEHGLRALLLAAAPARPLRDVIVTVADRAAQPAGLYPADFDLLARLPDLTRVTVVATDALLRSGFRERLEDLLPGLDEERAPPAARRPPVLVAPSAAGAAAPGGGDAFGEDRSSASGAGAESASVAGGSRASVAGAASASAAGGLGTGGGSGAGAVGWHFVWRDREEELAWVAGRIGRAAIPRALSPSSGPAVSPSSAGGLPSSGPAGPPSAAAASPSSVAASPSAAAGPPAGAAVVVQRPLPYLYLASSVCADRGLPFAAHDGLPLAAEPYAAAVDLVLACVREDFAREPLVALLGSPQFAFGEADGPRGTAASRDAAVEALDRELALRRFTGGAVALQELDGEWTAAPPRPGTRAAAARPAAAWAVEAARELAPLAVPAPPARGLDVLLAFLERRASAPTPGAGAVPADAGAVPAGAGAASEEAGEAGAETGEAGATSGEAGAVERDERVRTVIRTGLAALRDAAAALPDREPDTDAAGLSDLVRQWIEGQPGPVPPAPRGAALHLVDAQAAPYGRFDDIYLAGLVDGEWPPPPPRNVFYPSAMLAGLGWPRERARLRAARAAFRDLVGLARLQVALSAFALEDDAVVARSVWLDDVPQAGLTRVADEGRAAGDDRAPGARSAAEDGPAPGARPAAEDGPAPGGRPDSPSAVAAPAPVPPAALTASAGARAEWLAWRHGRAARRAEDARAAGNGAPEGAGAAYRGPYAVSALDRYLECPFKYFAHHALGLEPEPEEDEAGAFTPRRRGVFVHRVFEAFFAAWQAAGEGAVTLASVERALGRFRGVADAEIARLAPADQAVARVWLLGSAAAPGLAERLFMAEVEHPADLVERRLEMRLDGRYVFAGPTGPRRLALRGTADRIDLHADRTFRLLDYKAERPPRALRSLQLPVYAACAEQRLGDGRGRWRAGGAAYVAFGDPRLEVPAAGDDIAAAMRAGERRAVEVVDAIERGAFPPRPADASRCRFCPFPTVCRKDDAGLR